MGKINTVHDTFIRAIMADKTIAADYFKSYLPISVSKKLDFSTLTQLPDTYLSKHLQKTMSDIVYTCRKNGEKGHVKVSLLIEHKSSPDKHTPIQIGSYIFSGLLKQIENKEELSIIIPILFYHGKRKWEYQTLSGLFKKLEPAWKCFLPDFDFVFNNLGEISEVEVEALNNKFLAASLLALKYTYQKELLEQNAHRILILTEDAPDSLQKKFLVYFFERSKIDKFEIEELLESFPPQLKETIMSTADIFRKEGKKEGILIGREEGVEIGFDQALFKNTRNMLTKGFSPATICEILEVTPEYVAKIQSELNSQK